MITTAFIFPTLHNIESNSLTGSIPSEVGSLTSVLLLYFSKYHANLVAGRWSTSMMIAKFSFLTIIILYHFHAFNTTKYRFKHPDWVDSN